MLPEDLGGAGLGMVEVALIIEELCAGGTGATLVQVFMLNPIFGGVSVAGAEFSPVLEGLDQPALILDTAAQADPRQVLSAQPPPCTLTGFCGRAIWVISMRKGSCF